MNATLTKKSLFLDTYSAYYQLVFNVIYSKLKNEEAAADICQEVFTRFYENIETVEEPRKWIFGTMRFVIFEHFRKQKETSVDPAEFFENAAMSFVNGFRDSRIIIEQALDDMNFYNSESDRTLFDLIALFNHTYKEAAAELGISERQAKYRYGLTVNKLMSYFRERGIKGLEDLL